MFSPPICGQGKLPRVDKDLWLNLDQKVVQVAKPVLIEEFRLWIQIRIEGPRVVIREQTQIRHSVIYLLLEEEFHYPEEKPTENTLGRKQKSIGKREEKGKKSREYNYTEITKQNTQHQTTPKNILDVLNMELYIPLCGRGTVHSRPWYEIHDAPWTDVTRVYAVYQVGPK